MLWAEAYDMANELENIMVGSANKEPPCEKFLNTKSKIYGKLIEFGRVGYVTNRQRIKAKWREKSHKIMQLTRTGCITQK